MRPRHLPSLKWRGLRPKVLQKPNLSNWLHKGSMSIALLLPYYFYLGIHAGKHCEMQNASLIFETLRLSIHAALVRLCPSRFRGQ